MVVAVDVFDAETSGGLRSAGTRRSKRHFVSQSRHREEDVGLEFGCDESAHPDDGGGLGVGGVGVDLREKHSFSFDRDLGARCLERRQEVRDSVGVEEHISRGLVQQSGVWYDEAAGARVDERALVSPPGLRG